MNIFSVGDGGTYELTRDSFMERTDKKYPFYQENGLKPSYFAICPACGNPIQIINLYGTQHKEDKTGRTTMHGRHCTRCISGLPEYNRTNYEACPLHNPIAFHIVEVREDDLINEELKELVEKNRYTISSNMRDITGVFLTKERVSQIINDYINAREYCYTHANKYNIPYSILYTREAIDLYGQRINYSETGKKIAKAIQENSNCFEIVSGLIKKTTKDYVRLDLLIVNHRIRKSKQYITIEVIEVHNKERKCILSEEIEMQQYAY